MVRVHVDSYVEMNTCAHLVVLEGTWVYIYMSLLWDSFHVYRSLFGVNRSSNVYIFIPITHRGNGRYVGIHINVSLWDSFQVYRSLFGVHRSLNVCI